MPLSAEKRFSASFRFSVALFKSPSSTAARAFFKSPLARLRLRSTLSLALISLLYFNASLILLMMASSPALILSAEPPLFRA